MLEDRILPIPLAHNYSPMGRPRKGGDLLVIMKTLHNCPANRLDPNRPCDQDSYLLDPLDIGEVLLAAANTEVIDNEADFRRLLDEMLQHRIEEAREMVRDYAEILHIAALEERYPQGEYPYLWAEDKYGTSSMEIRKFPSGDSRIYMSYQSFLKETFEMPEFPAWASLPKVFSRGQWL